MPEIILKAEGWIATSDYTIGVTKRSNSSKVEIEIISTTAGKYGEADRVVLSLSEDELGYLIRTLGAVSIAQLK